MNSREQYNLAYNLLRGDLWDYRTYRITCESLGIDPAIRMKAYTSYQNSRLIDEIGLDYRHKVRTYYQLELQSLIGYMPYRTRDLEGKHSKGIDYGITSHYEGFFKNS